MGACVSSLLAVIGGGGAGSDQAGGRILDQTEGGEVDYHERFMEDHVIGEGEFGQVKLVIDVREELDGGTGGASNGAMGAAGASPIPKACKILRKGMTFKDNTIYSPIKPEVLRGEVEILRTLAGQSFCLQLVAVYESRRSIYIVTEYCGGGAMMEYVAAQKDDLRTEDVSRIAYQLFSAVSHCAAHGIMHRDIKPENIMFADPAPKSPMRLIDFGSGCIDAMSKRPGGDSTTDDDLPIHTTFAGSAFYISPELFQRSYNLKTDVWSAGVALYVLVAGYPADELQRAFNIMQTGKGRNLRKLPNLPEDLPDSYYEMLELALTYRHTRRPHAHKLLECEFVKFHLHLSAPDAAATPLSLDEVASAAASAATKAAGGSSSDSALNATAGRTASVRLKGSVRKHSVFLGFKNFERSLTAVLATMLSKAELEKLVKILTERVAFQEDTSVRNGSKLAPPPPPPTTDVSDPADSTTPLVQSQESSLTVDDSATSPSNEQRLGVILISELKAILQNELHSTATIETIEKLPNEKMFATFAYHVTLLHEFLLVTGSGGGARSSAGRRRMKRTTSMSHHGGSLLLRPGVRAMTGSNPSSMRSASGSLRGGGTVASIVLGRPSDGTATTVGDGIVAGSTATSTKMIPNSVHGSSVFASLRARNKTQSVPDFATATASASGTATTTSSGLS